MSDRPWAGDAGVGRGSDPCPSPSGDTGVILPCTETYPAVGNISMRTVIILYHILYYYIVLHFTNLTLHSLTLYKSHLT